MASKMAQLNVRMDPELKAAGDSVLDLYGISPSELIRALWEKIASGEEAFGQVAKALAAEPAVGKPRVIQKEEAMSVADWFAWRFYAFAKELGLDPSTFEPTTDEEFEELLYEEYLEEKYPYEK